MSTHPTPPLDEFLAAYDANDNLFWYLDSGDHLDLFDEAVGRMRAAEAKAARITETLADPDFLWIIEKAIDDVTDSCDGAYNAARQAVAALDTVREALR